MKVANIVMVAAGLPAALACGGGGKDDHPVPQAGTPRVAPPAATVGKITGKLTDLTTSLPLANVKVTAQAVHALKILDSAVTQPDGTYTLANLPLGMPLRVVSQPVHGAVVYGTALSAPLKLVQGAGPQPVDLALSMVGSCGAVAGQVPHRTGRVPMDELVLVHKVPMPQGETLSAVVRTAPYRPGAFRFEALPPGTYELRYTDKILILPGPGRPRRAPGPTPHVMPVKVKAAETTHVIIGEPWRLRGETVEAPEAD